MNIYRDYGYVNGQQPPDSVFPQTSHTQVWHATHDGGGSLLPYRYRSFISFSFGDRWIEDFDLIAYCAGDSLNKRGFADFEDLTTSYDIMDGQYYHGTHYKPNIISLDLVSDGIDQQQLDNFLNWFSGGSTRELVLAEHPNRAIMARVSVPPELNLLPFEKPLEVAINNAKYYTSTTLYKGTIHLELVSDTPFWYARQNLLLYNSNKNIGIFSGIKLNNTHKLFKEAIKIVYEDGIPFDNMINVTIHNGSDKYALIDSDAAYTLIAGPINLNQPTAEPSNWDTLKNLPGYYKNGNEYWKGACIDGVVNGVNVLGRIAGAVIVDETDASNYSGPIMNDATNYQFFYGGTAPSPANISFHINLEPVEVSGSNTYSYINCIGWEHYHSNGKPYNTITIRSIHTKKFRFTTPNVITSYNRIIRMMVVDIMKHEKYTNWKDIADALRDQIKHPSVRKWAVDLYSYLYNIYKDNSNYFEDGVLKIDSDTSCPFIMNEFLPNLPRFFCTKDTNGQYIWPDAYFEFDGETGTARGTFTYLTGKSNINWADYVIGGANGSSAPTLETHIEDVGDMLCSNWVIIEDRNKFSNTGNVQSWEENHPEYAHIFQHDCRVPLQDFRIQYKNRYL